MSGWTSFAPGRGCASICTTDVALTAVSYYWSKLDAETLIWRCL